MNCDDKASEEEIEAVKLLISYTDGDNLPYFDPDADLITWQNRITHWEQKKKCQFVTFRLSDSLPQEVLNYFKERQRAFLTRHPLHHDEKTALKFKHLLLDWENEYLDRGYGSCVLRNTDIRKIIEDSLKFYDERKYFLLAYVIMPNHVHTLVLMRNDYKVSEVFESIKKFTASQINRKLAKKGRVWSKTWDTMIRNRRHLFKIAHYIKSNPTHIAKGEYSIGGKLLE